MDISSSELNLNIANKLEGQILGNETKRKALEDSPAMITVEMNRFGVTSADTENPILKTVGLGPCVGVVIYHPNKKLAGLVHLNAPIKDDDWEKTNSSIVNTLNVMIKHGVPGKINERESLQIHIAGGWEMTNFYRLVKERLRQLGLGNIVTEVPSKPSFDQNIAFNSRSGEMYDLINVIPKKPRRKANSMEEALLATQYPSILTPDSRSLK